MPPKKLPPARLNLMECVRREKTLRGSMHYADRRAGAELAVAFKLFCAARQNAVLRRSPFPSP